MMNLHTDGRETQIHIYNKTNCKEHNNKVMMRRSFLKCVMLRIADVQSAVG